jgi:hypothetical protein
MTVSITPRDNPKLKFILHEYGFEVINEKESERRTFVYEYINSFEFKKAPTNWFITTLSYIIDFAIIGGSGDIYKEKNKESFKMTYENKVLKIDLFNCDIKKVKLIAQKINSKI